MNILYGSAAEEVTLNSKQDFLKDYEVKSFDLEKFKEVSSQSTSIDKGSEVELEIFPWLLISLNLSWLSFLQGFNKKANQHRINRFKFLVV